MQTNIYRALLDLLPQDPLLVGTVAAVHTDGTATVQYPGGGTQRVRGEAESGDRVFVQGGVITGPAPTLPQITIDI